MPLFREKWLDISKQRLIKTTIRYYVTNEACLCDKTDYKTANYIRSLKIYGFQLGVSVQFLLGENWLLNSQF